MTERREVDTAHVAYLGYIHTTWCYDCISLFDGIEWLVRLLWGNTE